MAPNPKRKSKDESESSFVDSQGTPSSAGVTRSHAEREFRNTEKNTKHGIGKSSSPDPSSLLSDEAVPSSGQPRPLTPLPSRGETTSPSHNDPKSSFSDTYGSGLPSSSPTHPDTPTPSRQTTSWITKSRFDLRPDFSAPVQRSSQETTSSQQSSAPMTAGVPLQVYISTFAFHAFINVPLSSTLSQLQTRVLAAEYENIQFEGVRLPADGKVQKMIFLWNPEIQSEMRYPQKTELTKNNLPDLLLVIKNMRGPVTLEATISSAHVG